METIVKALLPEVGDFESNGNWFYDGLVQINTWNGEILPLGYHPLDITDRMDAYFSNN